MKKNVTYIFITSILLSICTGCNRLGIRSDKDFFGRWKLVSVKISNDLGETWKTFTPQDYEWIEFRSDGQFRMLDTDMEIARDGEWHCTDDSIFYRAPDIEFMGGKCSAKIIRCDKESLIIQETDRDGIVGKFYYVPD